MSAKEEDKIRALDYILEFLKDGPFYDSDDFQELTDDVQNAVERKVDKIVRKVKKELQELQPVNADSKVEVYFLQPGETE